MVKSLSEPCLQSIKQERKYSLADVDAQVESAK